MSGRPHHRHHRQHHRCTDCERQQQQRGGGGARWSSSSGGGGQHPPAHLRARRPSSYQRDDYRDRGREAHTTRRGAWSEPETITTENGDDGYSFYGDGRDTTTIDDGYDDGASSYSSARRGPPPPRDHHRHHVERRRAHRTNPLYADIASFVCNCPPPDGCGAWCGAGCVTCGGCGPWCAPSCGSCRGAGPWRWCARWRGGVCGRSTLPPPGTVVAFSCGGPGAGCCYGGSCKNCNNAPYCDVGRCYGRGYGCNVNTTVPQERGATSCGPWCTPSCGVCFGRPYLCPDGRRGVDPPCDPTSRAGWYPVPYALPVNANYFYGSACGGPVAPTFGTCAVADAPVGAVAPCGPVFAQAPPTTGVANVWLNDSRWAAAKGVNPPPPTLEAACAASGGSILYDDTGKAFCALPPGSEAALDG